MRKLLLLVLLIPLISFGQIAVISEPGVIYKESTRINGLFIEADSIFNEVVKKAVVDAAIKTDSILLSRSFYNSIYESSISSNKLKNILISEDDYLNEYMNGYMIGQLSFYYHKDFNYDLLEIKLKKIKRELRKNKIYKFN